MYIGELSQRIGLSRDTIRFYEKQGLIKAERNNGLANNYKFYSESVLQRLLMIRRIKSFGFTLNETNDLLDLIDINQATCKVVSEQVHDKISVIDKKIAALIEVKQLMHAMVNDCCQAADEKVNCPTLTGI